MEQIKVIEVIINPQLNYFFLIEHLEEIHLILPSKKQSYKTLLHYPRSWDISKLWVIQESVGEIYKLPNTYTHVHTLFYRAEKDLFEIKVYVY